MALPVDRGSKTMMVMAQRGVGADGAVGTPVSRCPDTTALRSARRAGWRLPSRG
ncbi:hypothetical protein [Komagataeibacter rhaeticus]|uniref:Uncharacterized protein n=2 Tax=Komagataeibacter rhaeticus TaxID=215221 RepID=A0A858JKP2_9PROT|nr:hypothetical protein [Komagataeibacter rhaeticus]QIP35189.1 hypothetical protein GWK63_06675 [Komagataeibacter rhaeticus]QOC47751.1 hypothetical protein ICJ78_06730 [Komagataeibacter rhaeticus]